MNERELIRLYDGIAADPLFQAFLGDSGYANYGCWRDGARAGKQACDALVDLLLADVAAPVQQVLDVACGRGGTTRRLADRFGERRVTAIDLSRAQVRAARARVPGAHCATMDAARLGLRAQSFDLVIAVEAAFHFRTRADFLREALRVLRPGGALRLADVVGRRGGGRIPAENLVATPHEYAAMLQQIGFRQIAVDDVTADTWRAFRRRYARFLLTRGARHALRMLPRLPWLLWRAAVTGRAIDAYVVVRAQRP